MIDANNKRKKSLALVVDDDPSIRMIMCAALNKFGFDVIEAPSGIIGVELVKSEEPDIVLMDVMMPGMDGFEACKIIRKAPEGKYTQILMVTGLEDTESMEKAFEVGANGFETKPLSITMMGYRVQYMLRAGHAFKELHINKTRLAKTQELAKIGTWQIDLKTHDFHCSPEACELLGLDVTDKNITLDNFLSPIIHQDRARVKESLENTIKKKEDATLEYQISCPDNPSKYILNKSEIHFDDQNHPDLILGIVQDVSQLKKAEKEIRFLAFYDGLTGLANRMLFMDRLEQIITDSTRKKKHFALLFLDLDNFKSVNDTLGHHTGDLLLKKVADSIKKSIRGSDSITRTEEQVEDNQALIARLGGDEFTILVTDIGEPKNAARIARRLLRIIPAVHNFNGHEVSITASIGISVFPEDGDEAEMLMKNADTAMYHAKDQGKNTYQFFRNSMNEIALEQFSIHRDLRKALQNKEFILHYQPKINMPDRKIVGAEALIRWRHPHQGMIPPNKFIPIAEETGFIIDINRWVLNTAFWQAQKWNNQGFSPITMAVNLSGYKLARQNIIKSIKNALAKTDLDAKNIEIEITENILMQDTEAIVSTLKKIKDLNLNIALDDFGTGYSSLSYLTSFPVDTIKIDRSFVMECTTEKNNPVIIKAIIAMGQSLGKKIVAEGIETQEQYHFLKEFGCDEAQGFYFSRPVSPDDFAKLLTRGSL